MSSAEAIDKIFQLIEQEKNVVIQKEAKLFNTGFSYDGLFVDGEAPCYIIVVPRTEAHRLEWIINHTNRLMSDKNARRDIFASLAKHSASKMTILICVYGFDTSDQTNEVDQEKLCGLSGCKLEFRFFTKQQLA